MQHRKYDTSCRILVIDDNPAIHEDVDKILAAGDDDPGFAEIIDSLFDALTHDRVYRPAKSEREALHTLENGSGTHFDPDVVDLFVSHLDEITDVFRQNPDLSTADDAPLSIREFSPWLQLAAE